MREGKGDIWSHKTEDNWIVISTNGFVKFNGEAVMGRGIAHQARQKYSGIALELGTKIREEGNIVHELSNGLISFPVKGVREVNNGTNVVSHWVDKVKIGATVPGWMCKARVDLIKKSAKQLVELADERAMEEVVMPRVGCGFGELDWETTIKPIMEKILDQRFLILTY